MAFNPNGFNVNHSVNASGRPVLTDADRRSETQIFQHTTHRDADAFFVAG